MAEKAIPSYEYLGTLSDEPELTVQVAKGPESDQLVVVNRVSFSPEMRPLFRDLLSAYTRRPEHSEFLQLFTLGQDYCAVFKYYQGPSLAQIYGGGGGGTSKRMDALRAALLLVYNHAENLPDAVICSLLQPENIVMGEGEQYRLLYKFRVDFMQDENCDPWKQAAALMEFLLKKELKDPFHKALLTIHRKCGAGLYPSLPAMIADLNRAAESLGKTGILETAKAYVLRQKDRIVRVSWLGVVVLFTFLIIYLITELTGQEELETAKLNDIGIYTYVAAQDDGDGKMQLQDPAQIPAGAEDPNFIGIPDSGDELESEDYVVQPGDTLESICTAYYGSGAYGELVAGFNDLDPAASLDVGSVLRLPLRDQLADYLEH